jgi:hypothetical protein
MDGAQQGWNRSSIRWRRRCRLEHVSQDVLLAAEPLRGDVVCLKNLRKEGADRSARRWEDARNFKLNGYLIAVEDGFRHGLSDPGETRIQRQTGTALQKANVSLQAQPS